MTSRNSIWRIQNCVPIKNHSFLHLHREVADETHPLEGSRYHTHENGTLEIYRTTEEDAGSYSCWVENAMGKAVITANLDIRSTVILLLCSWVLTWLQFLFVFSNQTVLFKFEHLFKFLWLYLKSTPLQFIWKTIGSMAGCNVHGFRPS